jgi:hypothetical protein
VRRITRMDDTWIGCKRPQYGRKHPQMMDSGKRVGKRRRSVACKVSDIGRCRQSPVQFGHFLVCVFQPPEGRTENSPGLQAWEGLRKENRPERAADFRALFSRDNLRQNRLDGISETTNLFWYKNLRAQLGAKETGPIKCNNNMSLLTCSMESYYSSAPAAERACGCSLAKGA